MPDYGSHSYWDERYAYEDSSNYDWYQDFSDLKPVLIPILAAVAQDPTDVEILIPGCGNSTLSVGLYDDGYRNVTSIDISEVVITAMSDLYVEKAEMEFAVLDACHMEGVPEHCFDIVIDKGLLDALLCGDDDQKIASTYIAEVHRVIRKGGVFVIVSHGHPDNRLDLFNTTSSWSNGVDVVDGAIRDVGNINDEVNSTKFWSTKYQSIAKPDYKAAMEAQGKTLPADTESLLQTTDSYHYIYILTKI